MALPKLIRRLFENNGFGTKLSKDIIPDLDATNITSGKFTKARMPDFTTCTVKHVATAEEQVTLTVEDVQNGDIVVVAQDLVYLVQDDTKLNDISYGYLLICSAKNLSATGGTAYAETAGKLHSAITLTFTGCNSEAQLIDGSSNIDVNITSIDTKLCSIYNPVLTKTESFTLDVKMLNSILNCTGADMTITVPNISVNGWNCTILNNSTKNITITGCEINKHTTVSVAPQGFIKLIAHNNVYIALDSTPKIILE